MKIPMLKDMTSCTVHKYAGEGYTVTVVEVPTWTPMYSIKVKRSWRKPVRRPANSLAACNLVIRELVEEAFDVKPDTETDWWDR